MVPMYSYAPVIRSCKASPRSVLSLLITTEIYIYKRVEEELFVSQTDYTHFDKML